MKRLGRLDGYSLIEALVVLAIVALSSAAAFGVLRQSRPAPAPSQLVMMTDVINQHRARAIRAQEPIVGTVQDLFSGPICNVGDITFFPDGSVQSDDICILNDDAEVFFQVSPLSGALQLVP